MIFKIYSLNIHLQSYFFLEISVILRILLFFLQKSLRSNACSWYFALVSFGHLIFLYFGCLTRIITAWSGYDLNGTSIIYCRIRIYFLTISLLMARYFLCFISIDRWMVSSTKNSIRELSSLKIARWFIIFGLSFCIIFSMKFPIWYRIERIRGCVGASDTYYPLFYIIYNLIITFGPFIIMILFSLLVLNNIRKFRRRQIAAKTQINNTILPISKQFQRKDLQFIKLFLIQVIVYILLNTFYTYNITYAFLTQSNIKTPEQFALEEFLSTIGLIISYLYMAVRDHEFKREKKDI